MNKIGIKGVLFFTAVFASMCVFKLWYTLLWIFGFAILLTMKNRKRNFCVDYCPLGVLQDYLCEKKIKSVKHRNKVIKIIFYTGFTIYILLSILLLISKPFELWQKMLYLMLFSTSTGLILQGIFGKRYWCINMCPLGSILSAEMKILKKR